MKIYTKFGDAGETYLASGIKVSKTDARVALYGTCDELNSQLGLALSFLQEPGLDPEFIKNLISTQHLLFEVGSELAGYVPRDSVGSVIYESDIQSVEREIDRLTELLPEIRLFILPGGSKPASALHIARTVCRRLEREILKYVAEGGQVFSELRVYLNRLSDYLFTAARYANLILSVDEITWKSRTKN